eukprot:TRINITY_DN2723_c0_g1_i1.p1 TRINITY_DN2723_c0_g1~~TRINITY_DN2723_c0_g1_i1.p1  ORF type:complete len:571 (-),score=115.69 TRINITY_DN2723_c0_g1_i1:75-1787(-)
MGGACTKQPAFLNPKAEAFYNLMVLELPKVYEPSQKSTVLKPLIASLKKELQTVPQNAKLLPFNITKIPVGNNIVPLLAKAMQEVAPIDHLTVSYCELTGQGVHDLINLVANKKVISNLDLSGNSWDDDSFTELSNLVQSPVMNQIEVLRLRGVNLSEKQLRSILQKSFSAEKLRVLDLRDNTFPASFQPMVSALLTCNHMVRELYIDSTDTTFQKDIATQTSRNTEVGEIMDAVLARCTDWNYVVEYRLKAVRKSQSTDNVLEEAAKAQATYDAANPLSCDYALAETKGTRESMEDEVILCPRFRRPGGTSGGVEGLFAVFDGHGGRECSVYLSRLVRGLVEEQLAMGQQPEFALKEALAKADKRIEQADVPNGACGLVALLQPHAITVASVGDSMCVLSRPVMGTQGHGNHGNGHHGNGGVTGKLVYHSRQAKPTDADERQRIEALGGFVTQEGRVNGVLAVARALGDTSLRPMVSAVPFIDTIPIVRDSASGSTPSPGLYMLLACDGLWDVVSPAKAADYAVQSGDVRSVARKMRNFASHKGSTDNITVIAIHLPNTDVGPDFVCPR